MGRFRLGRWEPPPLVSVRCFFPRGLHTWLGACSTVPGNGAVLFSSSRLSRVRERSSGVQKPPIRTGMLPSTRFALGTPREPVAAKRRRQLVGADVLVVTRTRLFGGGGTSQRRGPALLRGAGFLSSRGAQLALIHHSVKLSPGTVQLGTCSFRYPALRHRDSRVCRAACKRKTMEPRGVFFFGMSMTVSQISAEGRGRECS